ncbi:MAG: PA2779 family protein [Syntrophorhabdales bacterium]
MQFLDLGFSPKEIAARLARMSDDQLHRLAQKLDDLKPGGDGVGLVVALLVIVVLQLTGHRVMVK